MLWGWALRSDWLRPALLRGQAVLGVETLCERVIISGQSVAAAAQECMSAGLRHKIFGHVQGKQDLLPPDLFLHLFEAFSYWGAKFVISSEAAQGEVQTLRDLGDHGKCTASSLKECRSLSNLQPFCDWGGGEGTAP